MSVFRVKSSLVEGNNQIKLCMGNAECLICDCKIEKNGQVIMFGNIKFLDYCSEHIQFCCKCKNYPDWMIGVDGENGENRNMFFCNNCYDVTQSARR